MKAETDLLGQIRALGQIKFAEQQVGLLVSVAVTVLVLLLSFAVLRRRSRQSRSGGAARHSRALSKHRMKLQPNSLKDMSPKSPMSPMSSDSVSPMNADEGGHSDSLGSRFQMHDVEMSMPLEAKPMTLKNMIKKHNIGIASKSDPQSMAHCITSQTEEHTPETRGLEHHHTKTDLASTLKECIQTGLRQERDELLGHHRPPTTIRKGNGHWEFQTSTVEKAQIKSACHLKFNQLRKGWGLGDDYWQSLVNKPLRGGLTEKSGKSGSLFWFSEDRRYVLKTINRGELRKLENILDQYSAHFEASPNSLLCRFMGAYELRIVEKSSWRYLPWLEDGGEPLLFVIMNNALLGDYKPDRCYDLKGTTEDRWVHPTPGAVLKDLNFADKLIGFKDEETAVLLRKTLKEDAAFLEAQNIMDYSVLLGVHELKEPTYTNGDLTKTGSKLSVLQGLEPVESCTLAAGSQPVIFYIGIIDLLQEYNFKKKLAHVIKASSIGWIREIDTEPPRRYAHRFQSYFHDKIGFEAKPDSELKILIFKVKEASEDALAVPLTFPDLPSQTRHDRFVQALDFCVRIGGRLILTDNTRGLLRSGSRELEAKIDPERYALTFSRVEEKGSRPDSISCLAITRVFPYLVKESKKSRACHECDGDMAVEAPSLESRRFTVETKHVSLQFAAPSRGQMKLWVTALEGLMNLLAVEDRKVDLQDHDHAADRLFCFLDEDKNKGLDENELRRGCLELNIDPDGEKDFKTSFNEAAREDKTIDKDGLKTILAALDRVRCEHLRPEFSKFCTDAEDMGEQELQDFFQRQGENKTLKEVQEILEKHREGEDDGNPPRLSLQGFARLLCGPDNSVINPMKEFTTQDMTRPLTEYWISSSHNTYLEGNQLSGESSVRQYVHVLQRGCRCIEIDTWDGHDGSPVVRHGYTATTTVNFEDVIMAINEVAFKVSEYPVIISIDQNCESSKQIVKQGKIMDRVFGEKLLKPPQEKKTEDGEEARIFWEHAEVPSPEAAKGKFIVKSSVCRCRRCQTELFEYNKCVFMPTMKFHSHELELQELHEKDSVSTGRTRAHCSSFTEDRMERLIKREMQSAEHSVERLHKWHQHFFSRVYPKGTRVDSSNFDPICHWDAGVQMVALNYQTQDEAMLLNEAMFESCQGGCGYTLKSARMREPSSIQETEVRRFKVHLIGGYRLPRPRSQLLTKVKRGKEEAPSSPFVSIALHTTEGKQEYCSKAVKRNGFDPKFDFLAPPEGASGCTAWFEVEDEVDPELCFLIIQVIDEVLGEHMCHAAIPLRAVRPGIRWVPLCKPNRALNLAASRLQDAGLLADFILEDPFQSE